METEIFKIETIPLSEDDYKGVHAAAHPHGIMRNRAVTPCYNDCMYMDIVAYYLQSNPFLYTCS